MVERGERREERERESASGVFVRVSGNLGFFFFCRERERVVVSCGSFFISPPIIL